LKAPCQVEVFPLALKIMRKKTEGLSNPRYEKQTFDHGPGFGGKVPAGAYQSWGSTADVVVPTVTVTSIKV